MLISSVIVSSRQAFFVQYNLVSNLLLDRKVFCIAIVKKSSFKKGGEFSLFLSRGSLFLGIFGKSAKLTKTRSRSISCHIVTLLCYFVVGIISILGENFLILTKRKKKKAKSKYTHDYFFDF